MNKSFHRSQAIVGRLLLLLALTCFLVACGSPEDRAAGHIAKAEELLADGNIVKAKLEAQNAAQIEPKNAKARLLMAEIAEEEGEFRAAIGHLLVAVDSEPDNIDARTRLGLYYFLGKAEEQAVEQADAAMAIAPEDPTVRLLNARVKFLQGDKEVALSEAIYALELDQANADSVMFLSGLYAESGDLDEAFRVLNAGIDKVPADKLQPLRQFELQLLGRAGRFDEVEAGLVALSADFPEEPSYKYALAQYYAQRDRVDEALTVLRDLVALDPEDTDRKVNLIALLVREERTAEAEQALKDYIAQQPDNFRLRLALAALYESQERRAEAVATFEELENLDPLGENGLRARNRLVTLAIQDGELEAARARTDAILSDVPDNPDALLTRAAFAFTEGNNQAAIGDLRIVLRKDEDSERGLLLLARSYVREGDGALAQDAYRRLLGINPKHPTAPRELAALLANQGDTAEAQAVLQARLEAEPGDTAAAAGVIQAMLAQQDLEGAEAQARALVDLNTNNALAQLQLGRVLQAKGSPDEAAAAYLATLEENPKATAALQGLVSVWTQNDQADKAVSYLQEYMEAFPDVTEARFLLAAVYVQQDKFADASREFETVIAAQPQAVRPYVALAGLYPDNTGKREEVYRRGLEQIPGEPQLSLLLASQLERQERMDDAIAVYETTLEVNADNLIAVNNLAALLLDYRDDDTSHSRALELAKQLESSDQAPFLDTVGWAYYRNGEFFSAVRYLERAVAGAGEVPILRYHLGMAYAATNNSVGARQELTQALAESESRFTGMEEARAKLAELESS